MFGLVSFNQGVGVRGSPPPLIQIRSGRYNPWQKEKPVPLPYPPTHQKSSPRRPLTTLAPILIRDVGTESIGLISDVGQISR